MSGAAVPDGHFYSPVPSLEEVRARDRAIFERSDTPGVALRESEQLALLETMRTRFADHPWSTPQTRYRFDNRYFRAFDAIVLQAVIRLVRPATIVEIGSGHSSAAILDTRDGFFDGRFTCRFIEPNPERLFGLLRDDDDRSMVHEAKLQDTDPTLFADLKPGDIVFIDSSHVSKVGSDVNLLFLSILPSLPVGVWVHVHDIFYPFEYPRAWVHAGRYWNEAYLLHALMMFNDAFVIRLWNSYLGRNHPEAVAGLVPEPGDRIRGSSIWIERVG